MKGLFKSRGIIQAVIALAFLPLTPAKPLFAGVIERAENVKDEYDYIIVGGGTAGLTVADRLSADGKYTVLVVEHGKLDNGRDILVGGGATAERTYSITSVPQEFMKNKTQAVVVGNLVGGSSAINGMAFMRGTSDEYDGWAELGGPNSTWNWEGVLPYFKKASYFTPPREDLAKAFQISYDLDVWGQDPDTHIYASFAPNLDPSLITTFNAVASLPGVEQPKDGAGGTHGLFWIPSSIQPDTYDRSFAKNGHYDNITRENYELIAEQRVNKILFNGDRAVGVQFVPSAGDDGGDDDEPITVKATKEVILAAGAIHTPQVLQLSGIGPRSLLEAAGIDVLVDLPGVGQKFQDQGYISSVAFRWGSGRPSPPELVDVETVPGAPTMRFNVVARLGFPLVAGDEEEDGGGSGFETIASAYETQDPAEHLPSGTAPEVVAGYAAFQKLHGAQLRRKNVSFLGYLVNPGPGGNVMHLHPLSHGSVGIDPADPEAEPVVDYRALSNPTDLQIVTANIRWLRRLMQSDQFADADPVETNPGADVESDEDLGEWARGVYIPTLYHPIGTAAKMPRELGGVVDEELLVHGVKGLSVVDASIMPTMPGGPTSQTVYMIAEKAADLIKARQ